MFYISLTTPLGEVFLLADDQHLKSVSFSPPEEQHQMKTTPLLRMAAQQISEYFAGKRKDFDLPLAPEGTEFQKSAWKALRQIAFGKTISYQEQAERLRKPKAFRAVGQANGKNPLPIIIPCHRVIGKNGRLVGYNGGLDLKSRLLEFERSGTL